MSVGEGIVCSDGSRPLYKQQPVAAVIGAASSQVSVMVASILQLFKVWVRKTYGNNSFLKKI